MQHALSLTRHRDLKPLRTWMRQPRSGGLRRKLLLSCSGLVLVLTLSLLLVVEQRQRTAIVKQVEKRGAMLATYLAAVSTKSILIYNFVALEQDTEKIVQGGDVLYAIILDRDGRVAVYSGHDEHQGMILRDVVSQRAVQATSTLRQHVPATPEEVEHYDIAVPVFVGDSRERWGTVRVGLPLAEMRQEIVQTRQHVLFLGVLGVAGSLLGAAWLARRMVAPLQVLMENTVAIAHGDLDQIIAIQSHDEIAILADNFNAMTHELRQHRQELEETNHQLDNKVRELSALAHYNANILASMTSGLFTLDGAGRLETLNAMAETITGVQGNDVLGHFAYTIFAENSQFVQMLETTRQHRTPLAAPRLDFVRPDGQHVSLAMRTAMLQEHTAGGDGLLAIFEDISPLQTLEHRLHRADRLAALGQMAAGVAHEIKNPLASVQTFVQLVSRKHHDSRFIEKFDRIVPQELSRINFIVEELLTLARPAQLRCASVTLPTLLQRVLDLHSERLQQQHIGLQVEWADPLPPILADAEQLQRGFGNIILNAIESMPAGGVLHLLCRPVLKVFGNFATPGAHELAPEAPSRALRPLDLYTTDVEVICTDTGAGIAATAVEHVFTPFWTTKRKGTGLGLALTHKIVEEHGGTIYLTSEEGHGTMVTVRLPLSPPPV